MTLVLTLIRAPHPQAVRQMELKEGELVIGRSADADWRIDDPEQWVSRIHCTVSASAGAYTVTDSSSGGLFLDRESQPLGKGNSARLRDGMELRLGEFVIGVDVPPEAGRAPAGRTDDRFDSDDFFNTRVEDEPRPERPADLPPPIDRPARAAEAVQAPERRGPPHLDDDFTLDGSAWRGFDLEPERPSSAGRERPPAEPGPGMRDGAQSPFAGTAPDPDPDERLRERPAPARDDPPPRRPADSAPAAAAESAEAALAAFVRGLGLDPADAPDGDPAAALEALGRQYRLMAAGLMQLLRMRAKEKGMIGPIPQTVLGSTGVNPLKFLPTVEDALAMMLTARSAAYADAPTAIDSTVQDLARHHLDSWRGMQTALRRMVDRFDPKVFEAELERRGLLEQLLAGGRRAKLWELYEQRYRELARSAETRFLGEVGADFRAAYEGEED
jgi:type VI secretion system protein ImpI